MLSQHRYCRMAVHVALTALVVAKLSHCSWQEGRELTQWSRTLNMHRAGLPTPVQMPVHDCDQEYGCICRGAIVVQAIDTTPFQAQVGDLLPVELNGPPLKSLLDDSPGERLLDDRQHTLPPLFGRQLRALYASLVI